MKKFIFAGKVNLNKNYYKLVFLRDNIYIKSSRSSGDWSRGSPPDKVNPLIYGLDKFLYNLSLISIQFLPWL